MSRLTACVLVFALGAPGCKAQDEPAAGGGAATSEPPATPPAPAPAGIPVAPDAATPPAPVEDVLARALVMAKRLGEVTAASAHDCGALATALEQLLTEQQPLLDEMKRVQTDATSAARIQTWMAQNAAALDAAMAAARPGLEACRTDPRIKAAFGRLAQAR